MRRARLRALRRHRPTMRRRPDDVDLSGREPDYVETVSRRASNTSGRRRSVRLGYRAPKSDATSDERRRKRRCLDVYLADIGVGRPLRVLRERRSAPRSLSLPVLGHVGAIASSTTTTTSRSSGTRTPMLPLKVTAAHEFFHAVQFAYDIGEDGWLMEGTATWMEEHVYDAINDNRQYLATSPLAHPSDPARPEHGLPRVRHLDLLAVPHRVLRWRRARRDHRARGLEAGRRQPGRPGHVSRRRRWRPPWELGPSTGRDGDSDGRSRTSRSGTPARRSTTTKGRRIRRRRSPEPTTLTRAAPSMNVDGQARPPGEPLRGRAEGPRARRRPPGSAITVDGPPYGTGPGGERHRDTEVRRCHVQGGRPEQRRERRRSRSCSAPPCRGSSSSRPTRAPATGIAIPRSPRSPVSGVCRLDQNRSYTFRAAVV